MIQAASDPVSIDRDDIAGLGPAIVSSIPKDVFYLAVDSQNEMLTRVRPDLLIHLYGRNLLDQAASDS